MGNFVPYITKKTSGDAIVPKSREGGEDMNGDDRFTLETERGEFREAAAFYWPRQGEYTLDDYYALPDEQRVELIDGVIYDMASPSTGHQGILSEVSWMITNYIKGKKGKCKSFFAPLDVQLDCDNKTMVQPDLIIICDQNQITEKCIKGAPDFVLEILSKSTRRRDCFLKLHKYENAGVREYWMIDPERKRVVVYFFERDDIPVIYGIADQIPVGIFDGELVIDFTEMGTGYF